MKDIAYNWDLTHVFKTEQDAVLAFEELKKIYPRLVEFKGKLNNKKDILEYFKMQDEIEKKELLLVYYLELRNSLDGKDTFSKKLMSDYEMFISDMSAALSFVTPELSKNKTIDLKTWAKDIAFKDYDLILQDLVKNKKHVVPERIASALSRNTAWGGYSGIFEALNNVDFKFEDIETKKGKEKLTHASFGKFIKDKDRNVRKQAYEKIHSRYAEFNNTIAGVFLGEIKETVFFSKLSKYKSVLEEVCKADKSDINVLPSLINVVNKNMHLKHRQNKLQKNALKLEDYCSYDVHVEFGDVNKEFSYKEGVDIMFKVLSCMGEEYLTYV